MGGSFNSLLNLNLWYDIIDMYWRGFAMKKTRFWLWDVLITLGVLAACFVLCLVLQQFFDIPEHFSTLFAFAVFLVSLTTNGYIYGLVAALISMLLVNFVDFPFFKFDFITPGNLFSAIVMVTIALLTGTLTTKVKHQEALKAENQMERMRSNLLRAVSHDLRTPLTTIYGSTTVLRENDAELTPAQKDEMLRGIQEDSQWLVRMVENLLSVTRFDTGDVKLTLEPTPLDELIDSVIVKFRKRYPLHKVNLSLPDELVMIPMDPILIEQVLVNILENAVQHAEGATRLDLQVLLNGDRATFRIEDNGCGIDEGKLPHIFSGKYISQVSPSDHGKRNIGIGLSVCATIIRAHGSQIFAENLPQGGAAFYFTLTTEEMCDE